MPGKNLAALLRRVREVSALEIDNLISEFHALRQKFETDHDRIQRDVAEYAKLSQGVMQLTADIPDSVNSLQALPTMAKFHMPPDRVVEFAALAPMAILVSIVTYASILF